MAEQAAAHALTNKNRIKDRIGLKNTDFDILFDRLISSVSDFIESQCGGRRFKETAYANEEYVIRSRGQDFILLKNAPISSAGITSAQYRAGTPSVPSWTNLLADEYELYDAGAGIIKIYTHFVEGARLRFSFTAGYKIDFANAGAATHTLPFDLSDLAERLAIKLFKKRESEGKTTEAYEGGSVTWSELLDEQDKEIIARYRRLAPFV